MRLKNWKLGIRKSGAMQGEKWPKRGDLNTSAVAFLAPAFARHAGGGA